MARVITVTSASAGVGKTVICVNLAAQLARRGKRVCLLDSGSGAANASVSLGLEPRRNLKDLSHSGAMLDEVLIYFGEPEKGDPKTWRRIVSAFHNG